MQMRRLLRHLIAYIDMAFLQAYFRSWKIVSSSLTRVSAAQQIQRILAALKPVKSQKLVAVIAKTPKTPGSELNHAKALRTEYYDHLGGK